MVGGQGRNRVYTDDAVGCRVIISGGDVMSLAMSATDSTSTEIYFRPLAYLEQQQQFPFTTSVASVSMF
jgi:hypothetical protein